MSSLVYWSSKSKLNKKTKAGKEEGKKRTHIVPQRRKEKRRCKTTPMRRTKAMRTRTNTKRSAGRRTSLEICTNPMYLFVCLFCYNKMCERG